MSSKNKFIDRNPEVRAAGKILMPMDNVGDCLKEYSRAEALSNTVNSICKKQKTHENKTGCSKVLPTESLKDLLSPELKKSRFVAFKEKFSENMYFKKAELGQTLALQSKPQKFTNENFIYGLKTNTSENAYDLICPNKTQHDIKREFLLGHDKYLVSHKDYLPSERIKRNYNQHFNPDTAYGIFCNVDQTGQRIKKCLQHCDHKVVINKAQKKFLDRTTGQLGKKIDRYNINLDANQIFGIPTKNKSNFDVRALIENVEPCRKHADLIEAISHINKLRRILFNRSDFNMYDLKILLKKFEEEIGFITFKSITKALRSQQIHVNEQKIRVASSLFGILKNENESTELVSIEEFWKILHIQYPLPRKVFMSDSNKYIESRQTTYSVLCSDREKPIVQELPRKLYDDHTTSYDLISPDIMLQNGLSIVDFKVLRSKTELKRIFKHILSSNFEQVWHFAFPETCDEDSCKLSVINFRTVINEFNNRYFK